MKRIFQNFLDICFNFPPLTIKWIFISTFMVTTLKLAKNYDNLIIKFSHIMLLNCEFNDSEKEFPWKFFEGRKFEFLRF